MYTLCRYTYIYDPLSGVHGPHHRTRYIEDVCTVHTCTFIYVLYICQYVCVIYAEYIYIYIVTCINMIEQFSKSKVCSAAWVGIPSDTFFDVYLVTITTMAVMVGWTLRGSELNSPGKFQDMPGLEPHWSHVSLCKLSCRNFAPKTVKGC